MVFDLVAGIGTSGGRTTAGTTEMLFGNSDPEYVYEGEQIKTNVTDLEEFREDVRDIYRKCTGVITHQFDRGGVADGMKGFLFSGPPGIGKTELAKVIAEQLCSEERFHTRDSEEVAGILREIDRNDDFDTVRDFENLVISRYVDYAAEETESRA